MADHKSGTPSTNSRIDKQAALPEGTLKGPFLGRQAAPTIQKGGSASEGFFAKAESAGQLGQVPPLMLDGNCLAFGSRNAGTAVKPDTKTPEEATVYSGFDSHPRGTQTTPD